MIPYILIALAVVLFVIHFRNKPSSNLPEQLATIPLQYGKIYIFYGTQTGTAYKLAQQLAQQGQLQGFEPQIIDLKDIKIEHFQNQNQISLFLLSNTGEGQVPDNAVKWMKILKGKQTIHEIKEIDWPSVNFSVFGLGNTQYQHYNKTAIDADRLLSKRNANRVHPLGLGDDNCSMQDDFREWRKSLWPSLIQFRQKHPHNKIIQKQLLSNPQIFDTNKSYFSVQKPIFAHFKIYFQTQNDSNSSFKLIDEDLDFKTKVSLKAQSFKVLSIKQLRQNMNDGSTLQVELESQEKRLYETGGNIALYAKNDLFLVQKVIQYFKIKIQDLDRRIGLQRLKTNKSLALKFVPTSIRTILEQYIDLQSKLSKSVLHKLSKFQSNNPLYFVQNSVQTTKQFQRITNPKQFYYLIKIIKEHEVKLSFQDFIELSDSISPRIFTIASHPLTQSNIVIAASIVTNGLISRYFIEKPLRMKGQLRTSSFGNPMRWRKSIFVCAGTGFAPFRGFLQEKEYKMKFNEAVPIISLYFGCKHQVGDFIYKQEMINWKKTNVINKLNLAFSRDQQKKNYVQDLLSEQIEEIKELQNTNDSAIYVCGSLGMGASIIELLGNILGAKKLSILQQEGRVIKQLW